MSLTICLFLFCQGTYFSIFCCSYICKWWVGNYSRGTVFMPLLVKDCPVVVEIVFMNQNSYRNSFFSNRVDWENTLRILSTDNDHRLWWRLLLMLFKRQSPTQLTINLWTTLSQTIRIQDRNSVVLKKKTRLHRDLKFYKTYCAWQYHLQPAFFFCISQGVADHCHYQGSIRGLKDSYVVLNTCSGLRYRFFPF